MTAPHSQALLATWKEAPHQREVDLAQARIRQDLAAGKRSLFKPAPPRPAESEDVLDHRLAEELEYVSRKIGQVGDVLSEDPILLHRHASQLQAIDLAQQLLSHIARVIASGDRSVAVEQITLTELKTRLTRQPLLASVEPAGDS